MLSHNKCTINVLSPVNLKKKTEFDLNVNQHRRYRFV